MPIPLDSEWSHLPSIKVQKICRDDPVNEEGDGQVIGISFQCGRVELFFGASQDNPPHIYAFGTDSLLINDVEQDAPIVIALLLHPLVRYAISRHQAGLPLDILSSGDEIS